MKPTESIYQRVSRNQRNSGFLVFSITVLVMFLGYFVGKMLGNPSLGIFLAFLFVILETLISFFAGDSILLAVSGAKEIQKQDHPVLFDIVEEVAIAAGLPRPRIFIITDPSPNAFATGRNSQIASVAVTTGILEKLNREELQGVLGHEMSHIRDHDTLYAMLMGVMVGSIALLCDFFLYARWFGAGSDEEERGNAVFFILGIILSIFAPILGAIIQMAMSRQREYLADEEGAMLTRNPLALASALEKISSNPEPLQAANRATQHLYIVNPLRNPEGEEASLFDTHPPTRERIRNLREMAHSSLDPGS